MRENGFHTRGRRDARVGMNAEERCAARGYRALCSHRRAVFRSMPTVRPSWCCSRKWTSTSMSRKSPPSCWDIFGRVAPDAMMCASSRMVDQSAKAPRSPVVVPCTLLPYDPVVRDWDQRAGGMRLTTRFTSTIPTAPSSVCSAAHPAARINTFMNEMDIPAEAVPRPWPILMAPVLSCSAARIQTCGPPKRCAPKRIGWGSPRIT